MANYTEHLYIGVGSKGCFFTLRQTYLHAWYDNYGAHYEVRSYHLVNLATTPDEAFEKAREYAAEIGLVLSTTREALAEELYAIQRASAEELAERERRAAQRQADYEESRRLEHERCLALVAQGVFPFGRFRDVKFEDADRGYVYWLLKEREAFDEGSIIRLVADKIYTDYPHLHEPVTNQEYIGEVGKRLTLDVEVIKAIGFNGFYGWVNVVTFTTPEGHCLVSKGAFEAKVGEKLTIKATVKEHSEYRGQNQTIVNRVAVI